MSLKYSISVWREEGRRLAGEDWTRQFAVADWINSGEERFQKEAYKEAAKLFRQYKASTLKYFASVSRNVPALVRTNDLPFAYHALVARFHEKPEYQKELLAVAVKQQLKLGQFRGYIAIKHPPIKRTAKPSDTFQITFTPELLESVKNFAEAKQEPIEIAIINLVGCALDSAEIKRQMAGLSGEQEPKALATAA
jgi:hypothetical protein